MSPPGHFAFYRDEVHEIRLRFTQTDFWEQLTKNYEENDDVPYIEASLTWGPFSYSRVGVRFKGNSSYNGATTKKKPFRIKLNEFVKGQKIGGMASFNLSNGWSDPALVREKIYDDIALDAGIVGPRANYAALYINDQYWGLYFLGEIVNGDFLTNIFGKGNDSGNLYKAQMGATMEDKGDDPASYKAMFEKQSNEDADDWTDMVKLIQVLNRTPAEQLPQELEKILDIDSVLTGLALDNLTVNLDSYAGMLAQNFFLYRRPSDNRFVFIRWDPSLAFGAFTGGGASQDQTQLALDYSAASSGQGLPGGQTPPDGFVPPEGFVPPGGGQGAPAGGGMVTSTARPLATRIWEIPQYNVRYYQIYRWLANSIDVNQVTARMTALHDMIRPWVQKDTNNLNTFQEFETSLTQDLAPAGGGGFPGGTPPGTPPDGAPQPGAGTPPDGAPAGNAGRGFGAPGLVPFFQTRVAWVRTELESKP